MATVATKTKRPETQAFGIRLKTETIQEIKTTASERGITTNHLINEVVEQWLLSQKQ